MRLKSSVLEALKDEVDIIEGWNSRGLLRTDDLKAQAWALKNDIPFAAGSDAHTRFELGSAYVEMADFTTPRQMIRNLMSGTLIGRKTNILYPTVSAALGRAKILVGHRSEGARQRRRTRIDIKRVWMDF
jgi:hypothetical protein